MNLRTTAIAAGLAAALGTGAAFAQSYAGSPPPSQQAPYARHGHHHGVLALISEEVSAGRISQSEGALLVQRIKEMKAEKRARREARNGGAQSYGQGNYPPPSQPH